MRKTLACFFVLTCFMLFFAGSSSSPVNWKTSYGDGLTSSGKDGKNLFLMFYTNWCGYCRKMDKETFSNQNVADLINQNFTPVRINCDKEEKTCATYSVNGYPTIAFADSKGKLLRMAPGFLPPDRMLPVLKYMDSGAYKDMDFTTYVKKGLVETYRPSHPK